MLVAPVIEILAGIPTVVYGFFAALTVGPFFRQVGENFGLTVSSESALAAGLIMGIMIIPYVSSLVRNYKKSCNTCCITRNYWIHIISCIKSNRGNNDCSYGCRSTTITTQIVMILVGDQEFDSPKTQSAFALGLTLFIATLILNFIAQRAVKKYREKYD